MKSFFFILLLGAVAGTAEQVAMVASTNNLASIAKAIGGEHVKIDVIVKPGQNPHSIEVLPSYMMKIARAKVYLAVGLYLDSWSRQLIDGSRNHDLILLDCSSGVEVLEKPTGVVNASMGDVHPEGNPHYSLDPGNAVIIAGNIAETLGQIDPGHQQEFTRNLQAFSASIQMFVTENAHVFQGVKVLTYHSSWVYLAHFLGLKIVDHVEPFPGISPTPGHLNKLVSEIRQDSIRLLLQEDYFSDRAAGFLSRETGIKTIIASPEARGPEATDYLQHLREVVQSIHEKIE